MSYRARCWTIRRNCSASPRQLALVFGSIVAVSFAFGVAFAVHGLWLVLPFVGVEMLAVAAAFFCYGHQAADYERIEIGQVEVTVARFEADRCTIWRLPLAWTRVETQRRSAGHTVWLAAGSEHIEVGRYMLDARRSQLAAELRGALRPFAPA